jgi:hypothetical protein
MYRKYWLIGCITFILLLLLTAHLTAAPENNPTAPTTKVALWRQAVAPEYAPNACPIPGFETCIAITLSSDTSGSLNETCTYGDNGGIPQGIGNCNLRRAIREASLRPTSDRPILIGIALPTDDPNYDPVLDTWTLLVDDTLPPLSRENTLDTNGDVTIDGTYSTNGGRLGAPPLIVNNRGTGGVGSYSLEVESTGNTIANISWKGGGSLILKADGNTISDVWVNLDDDGQSIFLRDPGSDPADLAGSGAIDILASSNSNVISGTVVAGAKFDRAINIDGDDNLITANFIGTRADGTVPIVPEAIQCVRSVTYDPANWYGGWGIQVGGSNNQILDNTIAGLHLTQTANETPPMALEVFGTGHLIQNNVIGVDSDDNEVGVCGIGIFASDGEADILDNVIVNSRQGFEEDESNAAVYLAEDTFDPGGITVRGNIIRNDVSAAIQQGSGFRVINFTGTTAAALRLFVPAQITSINGTTVMGTNSVGSPCPNCTIDFYLDDLDDVEEALTYLGSTDADSQGDFTFTLPQALPAGRGIRTSSTTAYFGTIGNFAAGTTTRLSELYTAPTAPTSVAISGPTTGSVGVSYDFNITVTPLDATTPFTYAVTMTDLPPIEQGGLSTAVVLQNISWSSPGTKVIDVTATNAAGSVHTTHTIEITEGTSHRIFLPIVHR